MFRVNDRVCHFMHMHKPGIVVDHKMIPGHLHNIYSSGGTLENKLILVVKLDTGEIVEISAEEALKID